LPARAPDAVVEPDRPKAADYGSGRPSCRTLDGGLFRTVQTAQARTKP
jgi:hypothetical protein